MVYQNYEIVMTILDESPGWYRHLLDVYLYSIAQIAEFVDGVRVIHAKGMPPREGENPSFAANSFKLHIWSDLVNQGDRGFRPTLLTDTDMLMLKDPYKGFSDCDIAFTQRPGEMPVNAGVVFVNPTEGGRRFMREWVEENDRIYNNPELLAQVNNGLNQTALVNLLGSPPEDINIKMLDCAEFNCMDATWDAMSAQTCLLHIKGALRAACLGRKPPRDYVYKPYQYWKLFESAMIESTLGVVG